MRRLCYGWRVAVGGLAAVLATVAATGSHAAPPTPRTGIHKHIDGGRMDGFVRRAENARVTGCKQDPANPICQQRAPILGNLVRDFDFRQEPRRPLVLDPHPVTDLR